MHWKARRPPGTFHVLLAFSSRRGFMCDGATRRAPAGQGSGLYCAYAAPRPATSAIDITNDRIIFTCLFRKHQPGASLPVPSRVWGVALPARISAHCFGEGAADACHNGPWPAPDVVGINREHGRNKFEMLTYLSATNALVI
jgi:hypothetical protein